MDEFSWTLCSDNIIRHNKQELFKLESTHTGDQTSPIPQEGDVIGVSYDHIQLKFYVNGTEIEYPMINVKGTVYPALYGNYSPYVKYSSLM